MRWLEELPILEGFSASADTLIRLGSGRVAGLEVAVPEPVRRYQVSLVEALHALLDQLLVDNIDDFILGSRALGFRYPRWTPHIAIGKPKAGTTGGRCRSLRWRLGSGIADPEPPFPPRPRRGIVAGLSPAGRP